MATLGWMGCTSSTSAAELEALRLLRAPVWVFDLDAERIGWINAAALSLFGASDLAELQARQAASPLSEGMRRRLCTYRERFRAGEAVVERWTFYPEGRAPVAARCTCSGLRFEGAEAMLVEAQPELAAPEGAELRLIEALRHSDELVSLHRPEGEVLVRNPAATAALGAAPLKDVFERRADLEAALARAARGAVFRQTVAVRTLAGPAWHDVEVRRVLDPVTGEPVLLAVQHDVSARLASERRLDEARREAEALRAEAEEASRAKSVFLATMSHELRTPMTGVLAAARLLEDSDLDADQREILEMLFEGAEQMVALVDDVLEVSRMEADGVSLNPDAVALADALARTLRPLAEPAAAKGLELRHVVDPALPRHARLDGRRFAQVVTNLVTNAIRYTDEGEIEVRLARAGERLRLEVLDTGIGVPSDTERLFAPFWRGAQSEARGGTGLGLFIARSLAQAMGGDIGAARRPDRGSLFWVEMPLHEAEAVASPAPSPRLERALEVRVLLVDDNALSRRAFARILRGWSCEVELAADGFEAVEAVRRRPPDVILMDLNMPGMDGRTAARRIRAERSAPPPIVALTADVLGRAERDEAVFDGVLFKPVDWERLRALLEDVRAAVGEAPDAPPDPHS